MCWDETTHSCAGTPPTHSTSLSPFWPCTPPSLPPVQMMLRFIVSRPVVSVSSSLPWLVTLCWHMPASCSRARNCSRRNDMEIKTVSFLWFTHETSHPLRSHLRRGTHRPECANYRIPLLSWSDSGECHCGVPGGVVSVIKDASWESSTNKVDALIYSNKCKSQNRRGFTGESVTLDSQCFVSWSCFSLR